MPHAPLGVFNITLITRNDVNVDMHNTLPGCRPDVNADIITIRLEFFVDELFLLADQIHAGLNLFRRQLEETGHMATRDHQGMPWADRKAVTGTVGKFSI